MKDKKNLKEKSKIRLRNDLFLTIVMGAPNAGKNYFIEMYFKNIPQLISSQLLLSNKKHGKEIKKIIDGGNLVPDEITLPIIDKHLKRLTGHLFLNGFPRNLN